MNPSVDRVRSADELDVLLDQAKERLETERREQFLPFGIPLDCYWPASRLYHKHSSMGPETKFRLTVEEVDAFTRKLDYKRYPGATLIPLPRALPLTAGLEHVMRARQSAREFSAQPLLFGHLAKLLEAGCGVTKALEIPRRAAPSPGALYPVEVYPLALAVEGLPASLYHYAALEHSLEMVRFVEGPSVMKPFLPVDLLAAQPPLVLVFSIVFPRVQTKYMERGYRFALLEAGHIAQNILLAATALGLSSVPVGGFWDEPFNEMMGFEAETEAVVYCILVGNPAEASQ